MRGGARYAVAVLAVVLAAAWWATRRAPDPAPVPGEGPAGEIRGFSLVEYDTGGAVVWTLTAVRATETEEKVVVEEIRLEFPADGSATVLEAPRGAVDRASRDVVLSGGVRLALADGGRVESDTVLYLAARRRIRAPAPVRFESAGTWAEADAVEIDPRSRLLKSTNARGLVQLEENRP